MNDIKEDIKILKSIVRPTLCTGFKRQTIILKAIENILNRLEQDERVIEEMAKAWKQDDIRGIEEIIDHFRKKCE